LLEAKPLTSNLSISSGVPKENFLLLNDFKLIEHFKSISARTLLLLIMSGYRINFFY